CSMQLDTFRRSSTALASLLVLGACASAGVANRQSGDVAGLAEETSAVSRPISELRYEVRFDSATAANRSLEVSMTFRPTGDPEVPVLVALPRWTPGAYELGEFAHWVTGFTVESAGDSLRWEQAGPESWRIWAEGESDVTV